MKINLKDQTTKEILAFSLMPFGMSMIYTLMGTALNMFFYRYSGSVARYDKYRPFGDKNLGRNQRPSDGHDC